MSSALLEASFDPVVLRAKAARERPAVLKLQLMYLRQRVPDDLIFVFEGDDDRTAYSHWVRRVDESLRYEPFSCKGKRNVLLLRKAVQRDAADLARGIYFFVDRDFDDLQGEEPGNDIFMTDRYSVESYLVESKVLDEVLKDELHCHSEPDARKAVTTLFNNVYDQFLGVTKEINFAVFYFRQLRIPLPKAIPERLNKLAIVSFDQVLPSSPPAEGWIDIDVASQPNFDSAIRRRFERLNPRTRYRGKFAYMFFLKWIDMLAQERISRAADILKEVPHVNRTKSADITFGTLAARSALPRGLREFLKRIPDAPAVSG